MSKTEVHIVHTALPDMVKVGSDASHVEESKQGQDVIDQETARRPDLATILAIGVSCCIAGLLKVKSLTSN